MASISQLIATSINSSTFSLSSPCTFPPPKTSLLTPSIGRRRRTVSPVTCSAKDRTQPSSDGANSSTPKLDRRDILIGLGGLYGATAGVVTSNRTANAMPVPPPEMTKCGVADSVEGTTPVNCCPPYDPSATIIDFVPPSASKPLRVRPAAHGVDKDYIRKFERALRLMKDLDDDDPRSFYQQANIHCAYCNGAYSMVGFPDLKFQVHNSWLFLPFHRCYLYFLERILGKLIGDETFAIPFWNWDAADGMTMPAIYTNRSSPLYDSLRDRVHQPPTLIDLDYKGKDPSLTREEQISHNLMLMHRQVITNGSTPALFFGQPYRLGDKPSPGGGSIEGVPHANIHVWSGDRTQPRGQDMGNFYTAGRDPLFYAHHTNIDRIWNVWKGLGGNHKDIQDPDYLETAFLFYDENKNLVRIKVKDCLDTERQLRYKYQDVANAWINTPPTVTPDVNGQPNFLEHIFPINLDHVASVKVFRPPKVANRTEEVLVTTVKVDQDTFVKVDVYINVRDHTKVPDSGIEKLGSFMNVPHEHNHTDDEERTEVKFTLALSKVLEAIGAQGDESIIVTFVPQSGKGKVSIESTSIDYSK